MGEIIELVLGSCSDALLVLVISLSPPPLFFFEGRNTICCLHGPCKISRSLVLSGPTAQSTDNRVPASGHAAAVGILPFAFKVLPRCHPSPVRPSRCLATTLSPTLPSVSVLHLPPAPLDVLRAAEAAPQLVQWTIRKPPRTRPPPAPLLPPLSFPSPTPAVLPSAPASASTPALLRLPRRRPLRSSSARYFFFSISFLLISAFSLWVIALKVGSLLDDLAGIARCGS